MILVLQRALLVLVVINAWFLLGIVVCDYLFGNLLGLFTTSIYSQGWAMVLLLSLSFSASLKATQLQIKQWCSTASILMCLSEFLGGYLLIASRILRALYINLYLLADVVFCVGAPLLIITASAGWWLLDEVSYLALFGYCCLIVLIVFTGLYSNLVRLLSLGYFFGWWLLSENMLLYPFLAPTLVQENMTIMFSGSGNSWLPVVGLGLIVYLLARRRRGHLKKRIEKADSLGFLAELVGLVSKPLDLEFFSRYLSLFCLLMAAPLTILMLNSVISYLNPHLLFAGFAIWSMDRFWHSDVVNEPALSSDFKYFANLIWKH